MFKSKPHIVLHLFCCGLAVIFLSCSGLNNSKSKKAQEAPARDIAAQNAKLSKFGFYYVDACLERKKGNLNESLKLFQECLNLEPDNAAVHYELATLLQLLGKHQEALTHARYCAQADPMNEWYQLILIDTYNSLKLYHQSVKVREKIGRAHV